VVDPKVSPKGEGFKLIIQTINSKRYNQAILFWFSRSFSCDL